MVIDTFYFLNELDLLEIRLNILDKYVDKFVIIEANQTFSGVSKSLLFKENQERFAKWKDKVIYYLVDDFPLHDKIFKMAINSPNTGVGEHYWVREFYIKESARKALKNLNDDDIVFISDLDEIWNPKLEYNPKKNEVLKPKQLPYLYYLNQRTSESWLGWSGTICTRYETIKNGIINHLRTDSITEYIVMENGGWHFNSIGGKEQKINASQHPVVNTKADWDRREVDMRLDDSELPEFLIRNKDYYISIGAWKNYA